MPSPFADNLNAMAKFSFGLAEALLKDVPASKFARFATPGGTKVESNHPAFCYGHLAIYPTRLADIMGLTIPAIVPPAAWTELFAAGKPCLDDVQGTIYPKMEEITGAFFTNYRTMLAAVNEAPAAVFEKPHPNEKVRERFPTVGTSALFQYTSHMMMHLGQVSAWRRMIGLGAAM